MATDQVDGRPPRSAGPRNARGAGRRAAQELTESKEALERNAEELRQANRRLTLLTQVANSLILADAPREHLKEAFEAVAEEIGAKYYFNYNFDAKEPDILTLERSAGLNAEQERALHRLDVRQSLFGRAAMMRRPLAAENIDQRDDEPTALLRALGVKAYIGLPLLAHGHLFGTIAFGATKKARFTDSDIELLKTLTDQCAATLDRSRLLESLRESDARYRIALSAGRMGTWETDYATGVRLWSQEGMELFGLALADGRGRVGGEEDEYVMAIHPDDRHLAEGFHALADKQDSFAAEYRVARPDGSVLWLSGHGQVAARSADGKAQRLVSIMADITERKKTEDHIQFLMREISHRSKNLLSVIQAIAGQTARSAGTMEEFETRFTRRLHGLAASHDILVDQSWQGAPLGDLVRLQIAPFLEAGSSRLEMTGPDVVVTAQAAQAIGLALHELATNAAKYGALSASVGKVKVSWRFDENGVEPHRLQLSWVEQDGPPVKPPSSKGFGHIVIERMVASSLDGAVVMEFAPQGLRWTLSIPVANVVSERPTAAAKHSSGVAG
jgi:PAS domain S-box-containing protein